MKSSMAIFLTDFMHLNAKKVDLQSLNADSITPLPWDLTTGYL